MDRISTVKGMASRVSRTWQVGQISEEASRLAERARTSECYWTGSGNVDSTR